MTPQTRGSVDYSSTYGIQVEVGLPDATFRKSGRVSFVRGALPKYNACIKPAFTCPKQSNIIPRITTWIKTVRAHPLALLRRRVITLIVRAHPLALLRRGCHPSLTGYPPSSQGFLSPPWARTWDHELRYPFEIVPTTN